MQKLILSGVAALALLGAPLGVAFSQTATVPIERFIRPPEIMTMPGPFFQLLPGKGNAIEQYLAELVRPIRINSRDGNSLTSADVSRIEAITRAADRASNISTVLKADMDGDLVVTRREQPVGGGENADYSVQTIDRLFEKYDVNGDQKITMAEVASVSDGPSIYSGWATQRLRELLALDPNGDGVLTAAELTGIGRASFAQVDTDGDGVISAAEFGASAPLRQKAEAEQQKKIAILSASRCPLPPASPNDQIIAFGVYESSALSPLAIGGQDKETNLLVVHVEKGTTPLYVILTSSESMLWKFDGDVKRIARVVATAYPKAAGGNPAVGISGVDAKRVTLPRGDCLPRFYDPKSADATKTSATINQSLGRAPALVTGVYSAPFVMLPSGSIGAASRSRPAPVPAGFDAQAWAEAIRYWPDGIGEADRRSVVSTAPVEPYKVFPSQAGIAQLIGSGAIVRQPGGALRVVRPIDRFPASMGGAHSERFIIARGVPVPPGDPVHSCVTLEDGTQPPYGARCPR